MKVVVVGGGIIGLMTAWRLLERGTSVTVIDKGEIGKEASYAAAGMLAPQLEAESNEAWFELALKSRALYPEWLAALGLPYSPCGALAIAHTPSQEAALKQRLALHRARGLSGEWLTNIKTRIPEANEENRGGVFFPEEGALDPRPLLERLKTRITELKGTLAAHETVTEITTRSASVSGVKTAKGHIDADVVVLAAGAWASRLLGSGLEENAIEPVRGVLMSLAWTGHTLNHIVSWKGGYIVPRGGDRVILGTSSEPAGFENAVEEEAVAGIRERAFRAVPALVKARVVEMWCGLRPYARRDQPYIGSTQTPGLIYATGHYRNGILFAPATAQAIVQVL
jgi:glycine oxidase